MVHSANERAVQAESTCATSALYLPLTGIALMTDADDTCSQAADDYADFRFIGAE